MDYSFLDKCFLVIKPGTWKTVNELLGQYGVEQEAVSTNVIRADTTVVESNIHYPSDSSLLWDTWRVASRLLKQAMQIAPGSCSHRFHDRKIKRLHLYITRYMPSKSDSRQRKVKESFRTLIERTGRCCCAKASRSSSPTMRSTRNRKPTATCISADSVFLPRF